MKQDKPKPKKSKTIAQYEQEIGELTATLQRNQADFENYKKRTAAERAELLELAKESVLTQLLPALDNFDRAATHLPHELENNSWAAGMAYIGVQLQQLLDDLGVHRYSVEGDVFDHSRAEAIEYVDSNKPEGTVIEQITPGYVINGRVVRAAAVKVSKNKQSLQPRKGDK